MEVERVGKRSIYEVWLVVYNFFDDRIMFLNYLCLSIDVVGGVIYVKEIFRYVNKVK